MSSDESVILCRTILLANNVKPMSKEIVPTFSADDVAKIKKFCKAHAKVRRGANIFI